MEQDATASPGRLSRIVSVIGTRPEAIKMGPVIRALAARPAIDQRVLLTGQHRDLADMLDAADSRQLSLDLREHSVAELRERLHEAIARDLSANPPQLVIVQGDTVSAIAGALAARDCGIPLAHVEAGLRSYEPEPWPEEGHRVAIDAIADLLFAPTEAAAANLAAEGVRGAIHVTGNSGIDALFDACGGDLTAELPRERKTILVTCHRRENRGTAFIRICKALRRLADAFPVEIVFAIHPNRHLKLVAEKELRGHPHVTLMGPLSHAEMVRQIRRCWVILTDSGGLQEEGPALGKPVLVMRDVTERTEAPANVELVGTRPVKIIAAVNRLLMNEVHYARMAVPVLPFGDGQAAPRIAALVEHWLAGEMRIAV